MIVRGSRVAIPANAPMVGQWIWRIGEYSYSVSPRAALVNGLCLASVALLALFALSFGEIRFGWMETIDALRASGANSAAFVVQHIRLPRVLAAMVIGAALGLSGGLLQTLARNRLASPDVLGINDGATLALALMLLWNPAGLLGPWWHALAGALFTVILILAAAGGVGTRGYRVLIVGLGMASLLKAGLELVLATLPVQHSNGVYLFSIGSLVGHGYGTIVPAGAFLIGLTLVLLPLARDLGLLSLPDDVVRSLGVSLRRMQLTAIVLAAALAGVAVSIAGPVGFVAIAAPIVARRLCGPSVMPLTASALIGILLTLGADTAGRVLAPPVEIPAGVITGILGGPFLMWVLFARPSRGG